ncbi:hypothetical protein QJS04_geneDACA011580 [Acorus gramineus]|uniref:Reverse transcriptase domain-containing protein n=1 Tax=Acorus gramineus TaxID=55184 RepID=A0AAV9ABL7_ACOGR|nr:hypothetical protein QJS04_geneDACA011580 [Acorus gramineus]
MEILSQWLDEALLKNKLGSFTKKSSSISHLLFADDLLIFLATSASYGRGLHELLNQFAEFSGLKLNRGKSQVFCGGRTNQHREFLDALDISAGELLVKYLGLPLFTGALTPRLCLPLVDKLRLAWALALIGGET